MNQIAQPCFSCPAEGFLMQLPMWKTVGDPRHACGAHLRQALISWRCKKKKDTWGGVDTQHMPKVSPPQQVQIRILLKVLLFSLLVSPPETADTKFAKLLHLEWPFAAKLASKGTKVSGSSRSGVSTSTWKNRRHIFVSFASEKSPTLRGPTFCANQSPTGGNQSWMGGGIFSSVHKAPQISSIYKLYICFPFMTIIQGVNI